MRFLLCLPLLALLAGPVSAAAPHVVSRVETTPEFASLRINTGREQGGKFILTGRDSSQQLLVTGLGAREFDFTRLAGYRTFPEGIVSIDLTGVVTPLKEGKATITASVLAKSASLVVEVQHFEKDVPVHFANEIVPVFTKFGCNAGGCHGKASGQNGFKLSLLGFEPQEDYEYLVKESRGRRILPAAPESSLLIQKATGKVAHGGGKKLEASSPYTRVLTRWIRQGMPYGAEGDPIITGIEVLPVSRVLSPKSAQQLSVIAKLSDGTTRDVTSMTSFESNQTDLGEVSETGLVTTRSVPGQLSIMARFQSHVAVFGGTIPLGVKVDRLPEERTFIDTLVFKQLKALGLPPSAIADDATFLRRVTIDLAGRLPTKKEAEDFVKDSDSRKYEQLVDRLLESKDHADYFANKWSAMLRNRRASTQDGPEPTVAFHAWLRESFLNNKPYDRFAREILTATGEEVKTPPVVWYRELKEPTAQVEDAAQLFLGQRIGCAKCHHHPFEKWSQEDYYSLTAFFAKVDVKLPAPVKNVKPKKGETPPPPPVRVASVVLRKKAPATINPRTGKPVRPRGLGGRDLTLAEDADPREQLVDWMVAKDNPYFARTLVNRYWKHFMGRGLVDPEDDLRLTNPASNPELLDAMARAFSDSKYDMRKLMRTICLSTVYRLSAVPNEHNASDRQNYSRFLPRRLHAEVLLDAIDMVTQTKTQFKGAKDLRAVQLPDNLFDSYFLSVFGRPDAASACECERSGESSLAQSLHMLNSQEILGKVAGQRAKELARDRRPHAERLRDLYLTALSRPPSKEETAAMVAYIERKGDAVQTAYEDLVWAVINLKEFVFNH